MHLGELADVICGPFGSAITNKDYQESGIPLIRITNISKDGYMDYSDIIYISEELGNSLSRTQVSAGDIVIIEEFLRYYDQMDDEIKELIPLKKIWVVSNDDQ